MFKMLTCCSPRSTEDDESVYDTYAEVEEDSNTEDRCSHRGAGLAHPPVHNVQGLLMTECKILQTIISRCKCCPDETDF